MISKSPGSRCTICIPTYNQSQYLSTSIDSALAQTCKCTLLISDDASTDDTSSVLARYSKLDHVTITTHTVNMGIGRHIYWLLQQPTTEFIVRLDSDDVLSPTYVKELISLLDLYPNAGYAHCSVTEIDSGGCPRKMRRLSRSTGCESADRSLKKMVDGYRVAANIIMFRRKALEDAEFGSHELDFAEDYDLCVRIADVGWGNVYSNASLAYYRTWDSPLRPTTKRKLQEILGLSKVFSETLRRAYIRRRWNIHSLTIRQVQLALGHAGILDSHGLPQSERVQLNSALQHLGGPLLPNVFLSPNILGRSARITNQYFRDAMHIAKTHAKNLKALSKGK